MVIPRHAKSRHRYRSTPIAIERRMHADQVEIEKGQARDAIEDQRKSKEVVGRRVPRSGQISLMGSQHNNSVEKRWQSTDICRLPGFE